VYLCLSPTGRVQVRTQGYNPLETICSIKIKTNIEKEGRGGGERES
jgi:hypothetical protein